MITQKTHEESCFCVGAEYAIADKRFKILSLIWGPTPDFCIYELENCESLEKSALKHGKWADEEFNLEWFALKIMEGHQGFPKVSHLSQTVPRFMVMQLLGDSLDGIHVSVFPKCK